MNMIYGMVRLYPFWALPLCAVFFQLCVHFRRKGDRLSRVFMGLIAVIIILLALWLFFRGDLHSDQWVRAVLND